MGDLGITFSLKFCSRALAAHPADKINSKWLVGTNALREDNEVRLLQYDPDQERLLSIRSFLHAPEIWCIAPSPTDEDRFITVWSKAGSYGVSLWRGDQGSMLHQEAELAGHTGVICSALWSTQQPDLAVTIEDAAIRTWAISDQGVQSTGQAAAGELLQLGNGALHPKTPNTAATASGHNVQLWDLRTMAVSSQTSSAHRMPVRDVSFSPHNEHRLVSGGDDCKLRFWDTRMLARNEALLELGGHSHWVWRAQLNPFYEQLVASSSSDSLVNLYHTPQLVASSAADSAGSTTRAASMSRSGDVDGKVHTFDEHEDSVYGLSWSAVDPWHFASLSYDGRVVVNKVPKSVKYKVLI